LANDAPRALCVDLDGTLVATDTAYETIARLARTRPWRLALLPVWWTRGRAVLKHKLAQHAPLDPHALPYRDEVLALIKAAREQGRRVLLVTAADRAIAEPIAQHLGLFDEVLASDGQHNLKGEDKVRAIRAALGDQPWDYVGDSAVDLAVWRAADGAVLVGPSPRTRDAARQDKPEAQVLVEPTPRLGPALRALRPHQWVKNLLVAVPMLTAHALTTTNVLLVLLAMLSLSLAASAVYLINDVLDLESDRAHPTKRSRPLAAGALAIPVAAALAVLCLEVSLLVAILGVGWPFTGMVLIYLLLTTAYSLLLKAKPLVDVITLAGLYSLRILAGGVATGIMVSHWLLVFSMFLFLSLAFAKRYAELRGVEGRNETHVRGRGYEAGDLAQLSLFGAVSGYLAVLVFALYLNSEKVVELYQAPIVMWLACPVLLYWVSHIWIHTTRGQMHDDPVVFALRDRHTWACVLLVVLLALMAGPV
jgi:4-hydroxybenzoate polyprenyltransferase